MAQFSRTQFFPFSQGGVAERLNAPVLKTGRPKGLVSSNLTPSANHFPEAESARQRNMFMRTYIGDEKETVPTGHQ